MNKLPNKRRLFFKSSVFVVLLSLVLLFVAKPVLAGTGESFVKYILGPVFYYLAAAISWLVNLMLAVMMRVATFNSFGDNPTVERGWKIVRDVCNNFFIIFLLVIAVSTVLNQKKYYYKEILPKLLIVAVLINFSKMFTLILVDFSQIIMLTFANVITNITSYNIVLLSIGVKDAFTFNSESVSKMISDGFGIDILYTLVGLFIALAVAGAALVTILCITIVLVFRIVMLWFLIILSPFAYLASAWPQTSSYSGRWWGDLSKYLIVGPAMMFFLYVSFFTMSKVSSEDYNFDDVASISSENRETYNKVGVSVSTTNLGTPENIINSMLVIGLMMGSLIIAQDLGAKGSSYAGKGQAFLTKMGKKPIDWSALGGKKAAKFAGGNKLVSKTLGTLGTSEVSRLIPGMGLAGRYSTKLYNQRMADKAKKQQDKMELAKDARGIDSMDNNKLKTTSINAADKSVRLAAQAKLAKRGLLKYDEKMSVEDRKEITDIINKGIKDNASMPEKKKEYIEAVTKYAPAATLDSDIYRKSDGKLKADKIKSDVITGALKIEDALKNASEDAINVLDEAFQESGDDGLATYLLKMAKDDKQLKEINSALSSDKKKMIWEGKRRNMRGELVDVTQIDEIGREKPKTGRISHSTFAGDEELRKKWLKGTNNVGSTYNMESETGRQEAQKYAKKKTTDFVDNLEADFVKHPKFMETFGHLLNPKHFEKLRQKSDEMSEAIDSALQTAFDEKRVRDLIKTQSEIDSMSENSPEEKEAKADAMSKRINYQKLMKQAIKDGVDFEVPDNTKVDELYRDMSGNLGSKDLNEIEQPYKLNESQQKKLAESVNDKAKQSVAKLGTNVPVIKVFQKYAPVSNININNINDIREAINGLTDRQTGNRYNDDIDNKIDEISDKIDELASSSSTDAQEELERLNNELNQYQSAKAELETKIYNLP